MCEVCTKHAVRVLKLGCRCGEFGVKHNLCCCRRERCCRAASVKQEVELESVEDGLEEGFGDHVPTAEVPMDGGVVENLSHAGSRVIGGVK